MGAIRLFRSSVAALLFVATLGAVPAPSASMVRDTGTWCPVGVYVVSLDPTRIALGFWTPKEAGFASGVVRLVANRLRYDVRFSDELVPHRGFIASGATSLPVVVRFPSAVHVDSAVVSSLDGAPGACDPLYAPWTPSSHEVSKRNSDDIKAAAPNEPVFDAPVPLPAKPTSCAHPFVAATTISAADPGRVDRDLRVLVLVTIDVDGNPIDVDLPVPSGSRDADLRAIRAAENSRYSAQIFDCKRVIGTYVFSVDFLRNP